ncbi:hypothetical protein CLV47_114115 [Antricoccus suffuscus]|uniref:YCII-related domain-containing protein n=1 Tax=Antricoccus suffuscus TaxID=1629062 RepID=A0A2T0ZX42_9ACTN|nr:YciI family protein [Antricoccus suffuscus]PRZ40817.1 hypothetical protein CLV47_114115 [Antricoccus suffuscus]
MPYFIGEYVYDKGPEKRDAARMAHRDYLRTLFDQRKVLLSGPLADESQGYVVYYADNLDEATELLKNDPYNLQDGATCKGPREWTILLRADYLPAG